MKGKIDIRNKKYRKKIQKKWDKQKAQNKTADTQ